MSNPQPGANLESVARRALEQWSIGTPADLTLITFSENAIYRVRQRERAWVMRVHRRGYHSINGIRSELAWMQALREDAGVETPRAIPGADGNLIQTVAAAPGEAEYPVVLFDFIAGVHPRAERLRSAFRQLGAISARMHEHARHWRRPAAFERQVWDYEGAFGAKPNWGHWRRTTAVDAEGLQALSKADALVRTRLHLFGQGPERFGLIHSDLRLANLLVDSGQTRVLDFDDCGFGWYLYDLAASVTYLEDRPDIDDIIASWMEGYRSVRTLEADDVAEFPTLLLFRRLVIMGWAASHPETDLAQDTAVRYAAGTVEMARQYVTRFTS